ncbi:MAG: mechanosensitive ion channel [Gammaproteobacteria bacterium]|nr:mechanosensitive ion channel [Gammaproteobacteria bacterium]
MKFNLLFPYLLVLLLTIASTNMQLALAQQPAAENSDVTDPVIIDDEFLEAQDQSAVSRADAITQLAEIQEALAEKRAERKSLKRTIAGEGADASGELSEQLDVLEKDIKSLENTFEQIASDGAELFTENEDAEQFDWREELITIVKPLFENVKGLTEKPRKIEALRREIREKNALSESIQGALNSTDKLIAEAPPAKVNQKLEELQQQWRARLEEIERENNLAEFQLNNLEGRGVPWTESLREGLHDFALGRGLTLLLALFTAVLIWSVMWSVLWLIRKRTQHSKDRTMKTGYRLAAWSYKLLTGILIAIGVMSVFYLRQDLLLLAIMLVAFFGAALALRNLMPRYINEGRLLLNLGSVRERERVMFRGVPWKVDLINVQTYLSNPEIRGVVRLPLDALQEMVSRPIGKASWFPSSKGDWVLGSGVSPLEVIEQNVETVELRSRNGIIEYVPTADYYAAGYQNLSRNGTFRVRVTFGVDYNLQAIALTEISDALAKGIKQHVEEQSYAEDLLDIRVEFDSAGESSLNYFIAVRFRSSAAQYYRPIQRIIQTACVSVCTEHGWGIPFPQLTVHRADEAGDSDS